MKLPSNLLTFDSIWHHGNLINIGPSNGHLPRGIKFENILKLHQWRPTAFTQYNLIWCSWQFTLQYKCVNILFFVYSHNPWVPRSSRYNDIDRIANLHCHEELNSIYPRFPPANKYISFFTIMLCHINHFQILSHETISSWVPVSHIMYAYIIIIKFVTIPTHVNNQFARDHLYRYFHNWFLKFLDKICWVFFFCDTLLIQDGSRCAEQTIPSE